MRYWKYKFLGNFKYQKTDFDYTGISGYTEITKEEYDAAVTIPKLTKDNINHQLHQNAETALVKTLTEYENSLYTQIVAYLNTSANGNTRIKTNINYLSDLNKPLYDNLQAFRHDFAVLALKKAKAYKDAIINGDTPEAANAKISKMKIDGIQALNGRNEYLVWLQANYGQDVVSYISDTNDLKYDTFLNDDEPEAKNE